MSQKFLKRGLYTIHQFFKEPSRLSFASRRDYLIGTEKLMRDLHKGGYQLTNIRHLKTRHVDYLVRTWQQQGISNATLKNR